MDHFIPKVNDEQGGNNKKELTFVDSYGNTLIYNGNKQFNFIDINNNSFLNNGNIYYNPSLLEIEQQQLRNRLDRWKKLKLLGAPDVIVDENKGLINKSRNKISKILGTDKILLEDIDVLTSDCREVELEEILGKVLDINESTKSIFEKGVGYE